VRCGYLTAVAADVAHAQVVGEKNDDIGVRIRRPQRVDDRSQQKADEVPGAGFGATLERRHAD
jgi:hypothetical protein